MQFWEVHQNGKSSPIFAQCALPPDPSHSHCRTMLSFWRAPTGASITGVMEVIEATFALYKSLHHSNLCILWGHNLGSITIRVINSSQDRYQNMKCHFFSICMYIYGMLYVKNIPILKEKVTLLLFSYSNFMINTITRIVLWQQLFCCFC